MTTEVREALALLGTRLREIGEGAFAGVIDAHLSGRERDLEALLKSNELWGGAGSVADQAGMGYPTRDKRRRVEEALITLGEAQIRCGITNPRTQSTVEVLKNWKAGSI